MHGKSRFHRAVRRFFDKKNMVPTLTDSLHMPLHDGRGERRKTKESILYLHRPRMHYKIMNKRIEQLNAVPPGVWGNADEVIAIVG